MKNLENKTYDSKREMQILDALEEVRQINKRKQGFNQDKLLLQILLKHQENDKNKEIPELNEEEKLKAFEKK